jgi:hypothetical protein
MKNYLGNIMYKVMSGVMISCEQATELISISQEENLPLKKRLSLEFHLLFCKFCRRYYKEIVFLTKAFDRIRIDTAVGNTYYKLPGETRDRLENKINTELQNPKN